MRAGMILGVVILTACGAGYAIDGWRGAILGLSAACIGIAWELVRL